MRSLFIVFISFVVIFYPLFFVQAATTTGTPDVYTQTINKVEVYNSTTGSWFTLGEGDMSFDMASADAGARVGAYVSGATLSIGYYNQIRVTISRTMQIQGNIGAAYTSTSTTTVGTGGQAVQVGTAPAQLGTVIAPTDSLPSGMTVSGDYFVFTESLGAAAFDITYGSAPKKMTVTFDVTDTLVLEDTPNPDIFYCGPPTVTQTIE